MTLENLKRVMWLLRKRFPNSHKIRNSELHKAIEVMCGTCEKTYKNNRAVLIRQGWIKSYKKHYIKLTGIDLTET
jgi:hypothetical protein